MGKKIKASGRNAESAGPRDVDPTDARLGHISTYADVADSEDEYFLNRDSILLDDEPESKRRRKDDGDMELSDEEILGYEDSDSEDAMEPTDAKKRKASNKDGDSSDQEDGIEDQEDDGWWGASKREYYDADQIETEADALEEEAEAKRLQQKKLSKMRDEDFVFDGDAWLAPETEAQDEQETVLEVLQEIEVTEDMSSEERLKLLVARYPEFEHLVSEFQKLHSVLEVVKAEAAAKPSNSLEVIKYWTLGCYVAALASYFAILTSPARDGEQKAKLLAPSELRDHDVMETLVQCRNAWQRIQHIKTMADSAEIATTENPKAIADAEHVLDLKVDKVKKQSPKQDEAVAAKRAKKLAKAKAIEASVADLYDLVAIAPTKSRRQSKPEAEAEEAGENSDFGEEAALDSRTAAEKAARKKSLKFYTSQIVQRASRRAGAGRDAGGDADIPYRERLRDRQARLMAEAQKRGSKGSKHGADLGGESDEDETKVAGAVRDNEGEYYDMVANASKTKRQDKQARFAAYAAASKADRVVEKDEVGADGKRKVSYAIEKNKGLTPKRSKDVRNPRVRRRKQYEAKQKKLKSMKPVWQGGEPKGGYQGELSGVNATVVKSVKL